MMRVAASLFAALIATQAHAVGLSATAIANVDWQAQFAGAVHWSALGVNDDSGATPDNLAALNALPGGRPIIGDCPHGGYIQVSSGWVWPKNLTVWQKPGCVIGSTNTNPNNTTVSSPLNVTDLAPVTGVKYYGLQITCLTPTQATRALRLWLNHSDIQWSVITRCGGQTGRFGDSYFAFNHWDTYPNSIAGNPGLRETGVDTVALSPGMPKSLWWRYGYIQSGDIGLQACQPTPTPGLWTTSSTDGVLYQNSYVHASTVLIANLQNVGTTPPYHCRDMNWDNITGKGIYLGFVVPGRVGESSTDQVNITGIDFIKEQKGLHGTFGVGQVGIGGTKQYTGDQLSNVFVNRVTIANSFRRTLDNEGCMPGPILFQNSSFAGRDVSLFSEPTVKNDGSCNITIQNSNIAASIGGDAIQDGVSKQTSGNRYIGNTITGVPDGQSGYSLNNTVGSNILGGSIAPAAGSVSAVGVRLTANPSGTSKSRVSGVTVSGMPTPIVCAPDQSNVVAGNPGAADCPP